jgi:hypothetical protein
VSDAFPERFYDAAVQSVSNALEPPFERKSIHTPTHVFFPQDIAENAQTQLASGYVV